MAPIQYDDTLLNTITDAPFVFLQPHIRLQRATLSAAKNYLDPLAVDIGKLQVQRQTALRKKRKRSRNSDAVNEKPLSLGALHTEGFETDQVWAQARRILDATATEIRRSLSALNVDESSRKEDITNVPRKLEGPNRQTSPEYASDANSYANWFASPQPRKEELIEEDDSQESADDLAGEDRSPSVSQEDSDDEDIEALDQDDFEAKSIDDAVDLLGGQETFAPDKLGLNDGFFSIDDFNKQADFLEQRDAMGEDDGAASDEEEVDWTLNPLAAGSGRNFDVDADRNSAESVDGEDGPTFGAADLNSPSDSDIDLDQELNAIEGLPSLSNTNNIMYTDFFAPPPRKLTKSARRRPLPKTQPQPSSTTPNDEDIQRAISDVRRDLFNDDDDASDASSAHKEPRSSHEKRQADLTAEIRRLEAEAVAKKPWTLSGEARAGDRPLNSLLEEDLDFERAGKPVPVITAEVSEDIESLIKRRIINREFDEVVRRRPGTLAAGNGQDLRRGRYELDDSKPSQSLAEMYEAEHLKQADPESFIDKRSEALKKEHDKIEALWRDVSAKLDALTNLNFRPKAAEASIKVLSDIPTIMMEDARPDASVDIGQSMLAPQEIYRAGENRDKKTEVATRSGLPVAREEMTREEKLRRRRREKERIKKAGGVVPNAKKRPTAPNKKAEELTKVAHELKRGGVKVIGKKGELQDVQGRKVKHHSDVSRGAGTYKL